MLRPTAFAAIVMSRLPRGFRNVILNALSCPHGPTSRGSTCRGNTGDYPMRRPISHAALGLLCMLAVPLAATAQDTAPTDTWSPYTLFRKPPQPPRMVVDGFLWIEAEDFADYGDWRLDTQFVHQMGSAYLLAAGVGRPIADATTEINIPKPGKYRLWLAPKTGFPSTRPGSSP